MPQPPGPPDGPVVDTSAAAARRVRRGQPVVLLVGPDAGHVIRPGGGQGRLALFVGDVDDPVVRAAAAAMAAELFGAG